MIVYKLTSPSGKSYIGITKHTAEERFKQHVSNYNLNRKKGKLNTKLQFAFQKYGTDNWEINVLWETESYDELCQMEIKMIAEHDTINNGYNLHIGGMSGWSGTGDNYTDEHKRKISESRKAYWETEEGKIWKEKLTEMMKGNSNGSNRINTKHSEETKRKIGEANKGKTRNEQQKKARSSLTKKLWENGVFDNRPLPSEETKRKISESQMGHPGYDTQKQAAKKALSKKWIVTFPDGHTEEIINLRQFCRDFNLDQGTLARTQKGGKHKGYSTIKLS